MVVKLDRWKRKEEAVEGDWLFRMPDDEAKKKEKTNF